MGEGVATNPPPHWSSTDRDAQCQNPAYGTVLELPQVYKHVRSQTVGPVD